MGLGLKCVRMVKVKRGIMEMKVMKIMMMKMRKKFKL